MEENKLENCNQLENITGNADSKILMEHTTSHTEVELYINDVCQQGTTETDREYTATNHTEEEFDTCYLCQQTEKCKEHTAKHTREEIYGDGLCEQHDRETEYFRGPTVSNPEVELNNYDVWQHSALETENPVEHKSMQAEDKPYKCSLCDYGARLLTNLKEHMLIHTGAKPFKCELCEYSCRRQRELKLHMMKHAGEKPYKCDSCEFRTTRAQYLKQHQVVHSGNYSI